MRRIINQQQLRAARRELSVCYLCSERLPAKRTAPAVTADHVLPTSFYGPPPDSQSDAWRVILDVHAKCERTWKQGFDSKLRVLHTISTKSPEHWPSMGHIRGLNARVIAEVQGPNGPGGIIEVGALPIYVMLWVRGFHAALYAEAIPREVTCTLAMPVPSAPLGTNQSASALDLISDAVHTVFVEAHRRRTGDHVVAWGGRVGYRCVWTPPPPDVNDGWLCSFLIWFPDALEMSRAYFPVGAERPWHGVYKMAAPPAGASTIGASTRDE